MKKLLFLLMIISFIVLGQEKDIENKVKKTQLKINPSKNFMFRFTILVF